MTSVKLMQIIQVVLCGIYILAVLMWSSLTLYWLLLAVKGRTLTNGASDETPGHRERRLHYIFPMWRKDGKFSNSGFWVWIAIPACLFLMFLVPIFPNEATRAIAGQGMFWTAILTLISTVFLNYYYGKKLTTEDPGETGLLASFKSRVGLTPGSVTPSEKPTAPPDDNR